MRLSYDCPLQMLMNVYCRQPTAVQMLSVLTQRGVTTVPATLVTQEMELPVVREQLVAVARMLMKRSCSLLYLYQNTSVSSLFYYVLCSIHFTNCV